MRLEELVVPIKLDDRAFNKSLTNASKSVDGFATNLSGKLKKIGGGLTSLGKKATLGLTLPILGLGVVAVKAASDLEQSIGGVESVFKNAQDVIFEFGQTSAESVGLSARSFNELATRSGALLQNLGFNASGAATEIISLTERASDMSAVFGTDVDQALGAINSALKGEFNPLEQFGVKINQAAINARGLELGLGDLDGKLDDNAKATAALSLIYEQTADTQGQFARESETLAGQQQRLKADFEDISAELGEILMPIVLEIVGAVKQLFERFKELSPEQKKMIVTVAGLVAVLGPVAVILGTVIGAIGTLIPIIATVGGAIFTFLISPIGILILAIIGLVLLWRKFGDAITEWASGVKDKVVSAFDSVVEGIKSAIQWVKEFVENLFKIVGAVPPWLIPGSPTAFEIGLRGVGDEFKKLSSPDIKFPDIEKESQEITVNQERIDYTKLARTVAHELQLVMG